MNADRAQQSSKDARFATCTRSTVGMIVALSGDRNHTARVPVCMHVKSNSCNNLD